MSTKHRPLAVYLRLENQTPRKRTRSDLGRERDLMEAHSEKRWAQWLIRMTGANREVQPGKLGISTFGLEGVCLGYAFEPGSWLRNATRALMTGRGFASESRD